MQLSKQLLGSTAILSIGAVAGLVTVGASTGTALADSHQSVSVNGFFRHEVVGGDLEERFGGGTENFDFSTDSEVHVNYRATDEESGLRYGATVEFETDTDQTGNTDEAWMFIGGGFGEIRLGDEDGSADNAKIGGFSVAAGTGGIDGEGAVASSRIATGNSGDQTKIRYDSPEIAGFQLSVSYTPNDGGGSARATNSAFENWVEGGLVYSGSFGGLDLQASGVFGVNSGEQGNDDFEGYGVGALVGFSGISVAGGFFYSEFADGNEQDVANVGIAADIGPASVSYSFGYVDDDDSGNEETNHVVSASIGLLPGVSLDGDISVFDEFVATGEDGVSAVGRIGVSF